MNWWLYSIYIEKYHHQRKRGIRFQGQVLGWFYGTDGSLPSLHRTFPIFPSQLPMLRSWFEFRNIHWHWDELGTHTFGDLWKFGFCRVPKPDLRHFWMNHHQHMPMHIRNYQNVYPFSKLAFWIARNCHVHPFSKYFGWDVQKQRHFSDPEFVKQSRGQRKDSLEESQSWDHFRGVV